MLLSAMNWYGFLIATGIVVAGALGYWSAGKKGYNAELIIDGIIIGVPLSVVCARIYYIIFDGNVPPSDWIKIWQGGLAIYGAVFGTFLTVFLVVFVIYKNKPKRDQIGVLQLLDIVFSAYLIAQAIGRWGNYANKEVYGAALPNQNSFFAVFPFAVNIQGTYHYAMFFYESILNLIGFCIIFGLYHSKRQSFDGFSFALYCIWYGVVRAILEGFRQPSYILWLIKDVLPVSVFTSLVLIALGIAIITWHIRGAKKAGKKPMILVPVEQLTTSYYQFENTALFHIDQWTKERKAAAKRAQSIKEASALGSKAVQNQKEEDEQEEKVKEAPKERIKHSEFDDEI